jgi:diguanylate cyclase (GGDEF)-like protein/PAS domain S-box-containing protein
MVLGIARDISARKQAEAALQESEGQFRDLIEHAHDLIQSVDPDGHFQYVNKAWLKTLGYKAGEIDRLTLLDVLHPDSHDHCMQVFQSVLAGKAVDHVEAEFVSKAGKRIAVEGNVSCRFKDEKPISTRGIFRDVTERKQYEEQLARMARRDPLTGVLNRYALEELLKREASRSGRYAHPIGFLMIDINRFKEINDRFGHAMGDKVLQAVAEVIQHNVRDADILVRYGGDEFLVILPETNGETDVVKGRILAEVARRNKANPLLEFPVTLAIGSAHWSPGSGQTMEQILAETDKLMYEDKRSGGQILR